MFLGPFGWAGRMGQMPNMPYQGTQGPQRPPQRPSSQRLQSGGNSSPYQNSVPGSLTPINPRAPVLPRPVGLFSFNTPGSPFIGRLPTRGAQPRRRRSNQHSLSFGIAGLDGKVLPPSIVKKLGPPGPERNEIGPPPPALDPNARANSTVDLLQSAQDKQMAANQILMEQMTPWSAEWRDQDDWARNKLRHYASIIRSAGDGWYRIPNGYRICSTAPYLVSDELLREGRGGCYIGATEGGSRGWCTSWKGPYYGDDLKNYKRY